MQLKFHPYFYYHLVIDCFQVNPFFLTQLKLLSLECILWHPGLAIFFAILEAIDLKIDWLLCFCLELNEHQLTEDLEVQFVQGLEHQRIGGRRGHIGLGYHSSTQDGSTQDSSTQDSSTGQAQSASESDKHSHDTADSSPNKRSAETKTKDTSETTKEKKDEKTDVEKKDVEKKDVEKKDVTKSDQEELEPTAAKKYKMTFVKASSWPRTDWLTGILLFPFCSKIKAEQCRSFSCTWASSRSFSSPHYSYNKWKYPMSCWKNVHS